MANTYSKYSSSQDVADYWDYHKKREKNIQRASSVAKTAGKFLIDDYFKTAKEIANNPVTNSSTNPISYATKPKGLIGKTLGFGNNAVTGGLESGLSSTIASPLTYAGKGLTALGGKATSAGFAGTGGLLTSAGGMATGASTALQGALTSMGPVGWALLAGGAIMHNRNKRKY
tara:strand:+ start:174 stop:692 length:519 start_codon:yes stop_codon:yes gene_type:complete